jgi:hypothetical protein
MLGQDNGRSMELGRGKPVEEEEAKKKISRHLPK